jgi:hypothetical protein
MRLKGCDPIAGNGLGCRERHQLGASGWGAEILSQFLTCDTDGRGAGQAYNLASVSSTGPATFARVASEGGRSASQGIEDRPQVHSWATDGHDPGHDPTAVTSGLAAAPGRPSC